MYWNCAVAGVNCKSWLFDIVALLPVLVSVLLFFCKFKFIYIPLLELTSNEVEPWSITNYIETSENGVTKGQIGLKNETFS